MSDGILTKYSASAGSGKTFKLTGIYLSKLFQSKNSYRKILAVTFTNKAASEMKMKILDQLYALSLGTANNKMSRFANFSGKTGESVRREAREILNIILHDYSNFSVGTIDSFFQKVLKAFTREAGLQSGYIIEMDHSQILNSAVDNMLAEIGNDDTLKNWLTEYAGSRIENGKSWNPKSDILKLAEEIFKEKFKLLSNVDREKLRNRQLLLEYTKELKFLRKDFIDTIRNYGNKGKLILSKYNVGDKEFFYGNKGIPSFLKQATGASKSIYKPLNSYVQKVLDDPPRWTTKPVPAPEFNAALNDGFAEIITEAVQYYNENYKTVNTAGFILENIYSLGILTDILKHVHIITSTENRFLLSDAAELLFLIIGNDQTPFIYERVGNVFENYMIDEFQDTSVIQWNNFRPLISNSMAEGNDNLVVGDVKQSIYRWRNSDWRIFGKTLHEQIDPERLKVEYLDTNWRSRHNIIAFNNTVFSAIPEQIDNLNEEDKSSFSLSELYSDVKQSDPGVKEGGYIKFEFIEENEKNKFEEIVLKKIPHIVEDLQDKGYEGSDIGILVRKNDEGTMVLNTMLDYQSTLDDKKRKKYNYNIVSNESLLLSQSPAVNFIISLLTCIYTPDDLNKALMLRNYLLLTEKEFPEAEFLLIDQLDKKAEKFYPSGYKDFLKHAGQLPLFEAVENIIRFFDIGSLPGNAAYLNAFQDFVLEFSGNTSPDITSFLEWWATTGVKRSIVLSDSLDSIKVMTIHKSKGLQFKVVILPFVSWELSHGRNTTILWINPDRQPFNKLGLVPVKYKSDLRHSWFADAYNEEMYSAIIDNLNLMYVAFTRTIDCLYGFCPVKTGSKSMTIASLLLNLMRSRTPADKEKPGMNMAQFFDDEHLIFTCGQIPDNIAVKDKIKAENINTSGYFVSRNIKGLRLKFHGENYLLTMPDEHRTRINYGRIMHEIFASVSTSEDIPHAINKMILEGKVPENDRKVLEEKLRSIISTPKVKEWFEPGSEVMNEAEILTVEGTARRPDRVIIKNDRAIVIDFKFGIEKIEYMNQVDHYRNLLKDMGYKKVEAFLWYVDNNKIINV